MNKNYAFIEMGSIDDAIKARNGANAMILHGDHITVEYANTSMMQNRKQRLTFHYLTIVLFLCIIITITIIIFCIQYVKFYCL